MVHQTALHGEGPAVYRGSYLLPPEIAKELETDWDLPAGQLASP